jgi:hypothetical protein
MFSAMLLATVALVSSVKTDEAAALADRQKFPSTDWWRYYYITTSTGHPDFEQLHQSVALRLVIPSCSRQPVLEKCLPVQVGPTLYRIDLQDLMWSHTAWRKFIANYPYSRHKNPLMIRADWLCVHLTDSNEQTDNGGVPAYYELLFGVVPKTRDEALAILGVNTKEQFQFGQIEGKSGVSVSGVRWIANLPIARGYAWGTRDVLELQRDKDMLERPDGSFKHDGEEWIIGLWKKARRPDGTYINGALQAYFLANGDGSIATKANINLVVDHTKFRGNPEIKNAGSCIQCHGSGLNPTKVDEFKATLESGVYATSDYYTKEKVEAFHFSDLPKEIRRNNEDFAAIVEVACQCPPEEAAAAFKSVVNTYDRPLTPSRAAWELGTSSDDLRLALGLASKVGAQLPARIAGLAHKRPCPRVAFEPAYVDLHYGIIPSWREKK